MAKTILTVQPLTRNDLSILAKSFEVSFEYYVTHNSPFFDDYLRSLRTLVGLGFTAVLADKDLLCIYQRYFNYFMAEEEGDFSKNPNAIPIIAQSTDEMVGNAVISFKALGHPRYYEDFLKALDITTEDPQSHDKVM